MKSSGVPSPQYNGVANVVKFFSISETEVKKKKEDEDPYVIRR